MSLPLKTISVENISLTKDGNRLVKDSAFTIGSGEFVVLLGPNGAGKTSLLRSLIGIETPTSGRAVLGETPINALTPTERARHIAYLPQSRALAWPSRVKDIVALGRFAYGASPATLSGQDESAVEAALKACDLNHLKERKADTLSGGEMARLHFARALAAETDYLIADEPVSALDPRHQFRILDLIKNYTKSGGLQTKDGGEKKGGALIILHDIALAAQYADRLIWMKAGEIIADGSVEDTLSAEQLRRVYGVKAEIKGRTVTLLGPE